MCAFINGLPTICLIRVFNETPSNLNRTIKEMQQKASSCCLLLYLYVNIFRLKLCLSLPHILIKEWKLKKETHTLNHSLKSKGQRRERQRNVRVPYPLLNTATTSRFYQSKVLSPQAFCQAGGGHSGLGPILDLGSYFGQRDQNLKSTSTTPCNYPVHV